MSSSRSVGSSTSKWRIASRSTWTWRARPWHECTWIERSSGPSSKSPAGALSARTSCCTRSSREPGAQSADSSPSSTDCGADKPRDSAPANSTVRSRYGRPHDPSSGCRAAVSDRSSARRDARGREPASVASRTREVATGDGSSSKRCTSRWALTASISSMKDAPLGSVVTPKMASRGGRSRASFPVRRSSSRPGSRSGGLGTPTRARTRRHRWGCQLSCSASGRPVPSTSWPALQCSTSSGRRTA